MALNEGPAAPEDVVVRAVEAGAAVGAVRARPVVVELAPAPGANN